MACADSTKPAVFTEEDFQQARIFRASNLVKSFSTATLPKEMKDWVLRVSRTYSEYAFTDAENKLKAEEKQ
jgi:hypothetical protein